MGTLNDLWPTPTPQDSKELLRLLLRHQYAITDLLSIREDESGSKALDALLRILRTESRYPGGDELKRALRTLEGLAEDARWREEEACAREHGYTAPQRPEPRVKLARIGAEPAKPTARRRKR